MEAIEEFKLPDVNIMLVSLKAGGLGLNLTMASYVFLLGSVFLRMSEMAKYLPSLFFKIFGGTLL